MTNWMRNQIINLHNAVSALVAAKRDKLAERLLSIRETSSLFYNRIMHNIEHGQERFKNCSVRIAILVEGYKLSVNMPL